MTPMNISTLIGKTLTKIFVSEDEVRMECDDGKVYLMRHDQSCCESVQCEDIVGDTGDLIGNPILLAEEVTSSDNPKDAVDVCNGTFLWTFYKIATIKGSITIRWYGTSNGYYSEEVDFFEEGKDRN
jgi:hypothetical protein